MSSTPAAAAPAAPAPRADGLAFAPPNVALTTFGLALASFMQVLDTTIANVSLPAISGNLGGSANQATWVITSFAVSTAIALPLTGWLARRFGERKLFMVSTLAFVIASLLCGLANSMGLLVVARALQGFVAGPMYPVTQALLLSIYPPAKRGQAIALLAMVTVVAPIAGPILGGWITDNYSWEWIFFINMPLGIFASVVVGAQLQGAPGKARKAEDGLRRPDHAGARRGCAADPAGPGQRRRLVPLAVDRGAGDRGGDLAGRLRDLGTHRQGPDRQPAPVPPPQFRGRHDRDGAGLLRLLQRQHPGAAVAAAQPWLHRDLGGFRDRADRLPAGDPGAVDRQVRRQVRPAHAGHAGVHRDGHDQLHALALQPRRQLRTRGLRATAAGTWRRAVLHAGAADPAVRPGAARDLRGLGPDDVRAHAGRQFRRIADDLCLVAAHCRAPRATHRAPQRHRPDHAGNGSPLWRGRHAARRLCAGPGSSPSNPCRSASTRSSTCSASSS